MSEILKQLTARFSGKKSVFHVLDFTLAFYVLERHSDSPAVACAVVGAVAVSSLGFYLGQGYADGTQKRT